MLGGLRWGFRVAHQGVLGSWVLLPNGVPAGSGIDHLAAPAEDRSLIYAAFAGGMALQRADLFAPLLARGAGSGSRR